MRRIAIIPTLLTLGNGVCGFAAMTVASKIDSTVSHAKAQEWFALSGWLILAAMVFDMLDGHVARLSRTASKFGGELDSLCDAVSFGVAPAFLLLKLGPSWDHEILHPMLAGVAAIYACCTWLRLARFNVGNSTDATSHKRFQGLPSPGAAGCLASIAVLRGEFADRLTGYSRLFSELDPARVRQGVEKFVELASPLGALIVALLMVSNIPFPHLTGKLLRGKKHLGRVVQLLLAGFLGYFFRELTLMAIFWGYAIYFPLRAMWVSQFRSEGPSTSEEKSSPR